MHRAQWRQEIADAEHVATQTQPLAQPRVATCYACGRDATKWIRSTSAHFSAPRCDECAERLAAMFASRGVKDVTVDAIQQPESVGGAAS